MLKIEVHKKTIYNAVVTIQKTHQRRAKNNEARALCDSVHEAPLPLRGDGSGQLDGEDLIKKHNAADRFLWIS